MQNELLKADYTIGIDDVQFDGSIYETKTYYKQIETENFLIDLEVEVQFQFESLEYFEITEHQLIDIEVLNSESELQDISDELFKNIDNLIQIDWV